MTHECAISFRASPLAPWSRSTFSGVDLGLYMSTAATLASQKRIQLDDKISSMEQSLMSFCP